ncbi:MAG: hypothetical protein M3384_21165 [Acidobacteriota bacterium]|nr:hypothetical protein [Acidobacteriota bacterium]
MKKLFGLICLSLLITCFGAISLLAQDADVKAKKIRIGVMPVKTTGVGEGIDPAQFGAAIQNSLGEYLKTPEIEIVPIEAKLSSAIEAELKEKAIDYVVSATVGHKKGGGGFGGMFGTIAPVLGQVAPMAGIGGSVAGQIAGSVATTAIMTAATMSQNVKAKDSVELNVSMQKTADKSTVLTKQFKAKAKSNGEDIITPLIEQSAQAIVDTATGKVQPAQTQKK